MNWIFHVLCGIWIWNGKVFAQKKMGYSQYEIKLEIFVVECRSWLAENVVLWFLYIVVNVTRHTWHVYQMCIGGVTL